MEMGGKWAGWSTGNCIQAMGIQPQTKQLPQHHAWEQPYKRGAGTVLLYPHVTAVT